MSRRIKDNNTKEKQWNKEDPELKCMDTQIYFMPE